MDKMKSSEVATGDKPTPKGRKGTWLDTLQMNPKQYWPKKYRYTVEPYPGSTAVLTVKERDHYEENGYIIVKNLLPKATLDSLKIMTQGTHHNDESDEDLKRRVTDALTQYSKDASIVRYIESFCGPNIMSMIQALMVQQTTPQSVCRMNKSGDTPETSGGSIKMLIPMMKGATSDGSSNVESITETWIEPKKLFRDLFSLPFRPADRIVSVWTPLDPHDQMNSSVSGDSNSSPAPSCFVMIPGSHKSSLLQTIEGDQTIIYEHLPSDLAEKTPKQLSLNPGDTIFYHPLLLHGFQSSSLSTTITSTPGPFKRAFSCHFASADCDFVSMSGHESLIPPHLVQLTSTTNLTTDEQQNVWRNRAVLVKGQISRL